MNKFEINEYLKNENGAKGTCRTCSKEVQNKVISTSSQSQSALTYSQSQYSQSALNDATSSGFDGNSVAGDGPSNKRQKIQLSMGPFLDNLTVGQRDDITESFTTLVYRTGIPFRVAESNAMKDLIKKLRPAYSDFIPSAATIGNSLLTKECCSNVGKLF